MKEINKRQWSRLCGDLSREHRFAKTDVITMDSDREETTLFSGTPLLGLALARKGRKISALEVTLGQMTGDSLEPSVYSLSMPTDIHYETSDESGCCAIEVRNEENRKLTIRLRPDSTVESYDRFVRETAYSLSEARGFAPGYELEDWLKAEQITQGIVTGVDRRVSV